MQVRRGTASSHLRSHRNGWPLFGFPDGSFRCGTGWLCIAAEFLERLPEVVRVDGLFEERFDPERAQLFLIRSIRRVDQRNNREIRKTIQSGQLFTKVGELESLEMIIGDDQFGPQALRRVE